MDLKSYLLSVKKIASNKVNYFLLWIDMYKKFTESGKEDSDFYKNLESRYEIWQIEQARVAVLYYRCYIKSRSGNTQTKPCKMVAFENAETKMKNELRLQHKSYKTEKAYMHWLGKFYSYLATNNCLQIDEQAITEFLTYLAVVRHVSFSTQNQAFNALLFACRYVYNIESVDLKNVPKSTLPKKLPVVLLKSEILDIFANLHGVHKLLAELIYGSGLRLEECLSLRIKDLDFSTKSLTIRSGKGNKDRIAILPGNLEERLKKQIIVSRSVFDKDRADNIAGVCVPDAIDRKYLPLT